MPPWGTTGWRASQHRRMTAETSWVEAGRTTSFGMTGGAPLQSV